MKDSEIIELFFQRNSMAISETQSKYGCTCSRIAYNILHNHEDSEECVNDTYMKAWDSIPPTVPQHLGAWLYKITRNLALSMLSAKNAKKRGGGETVLALHELDECVSGTPRSDDSADIAQAIDSFLTVLPAMDRFIFVRRYWFMDSTAEISEQCGIKTSTVTTKLHRMRIKLKKHLEKEGIEI